MPSVAPTALSLLAWAWPPIDGAQAFAVKLRMCRSICTVGCLFLILSCVFAQNGPGSTQKNAGPASSPGIYRNVSLGFSYKIPFGWVDRTQTLQQGSESSTSHVLLAIFERPPEATGDTINSGVVIAAENASSYPKVKTALDYFEPLAEATTSQGFQIVKQPYAFAIGSKQLVRQDFSKERGKLTMCQSSLVMLKKGSIVSFTFIAGSFDEVDELIQNLNFGAASRSPHE